MVGHAAGARAAHRRSRTGSGSSSSPGSIPASRDTASDHRRSRTAHRASENATIDLPGQSIPPTRAVAGIASYSNATTEYSPSRHGVARSTVCRHQPRVVSERRWARLSWKVHSRFQRPAYRVTTSLDPILGSSESYCQMSWTRFDSGGVLNLDPIDELGPRDDCLETG